MENVQFILFNALPLIFLLLLTIPFHELGHYLAIRLFGGKINYVELTSGKPIFKYGKFSIGLKATGLVNWDDTSINSNKKKAFVALAGPLTDWVLSVITFTFISFLYAYEVLSSSTYNFFCIFSVAYFLSGIFDMIPNKKKENDGYNFLTRLNLLKK